MQISPRNSRWTTLGLIVVMCIGGAMCQPAPPASAVACESGSKPSAKVLTKRSTYIGNSKNR